MPVFAASVLRPLTVRAASSSPSVVRMPSDFSLEAAKDGRPSISEIGYVMVLDMKKAALSELAEARGPCDDLAHSIRSDFVAAEPEKFTSDVLNLTHAQTKPHQLGAERHQATAHQISETAAIARGRDRSFRTGNLIYQGLNFVGGALVAKKSENDADGFFSHSIIDAGLYGQPPNQFVHIGPLSTGYVPGPCPRIYLDPPRCELQATTAFESAIHLRSRDECCSNARAVAKFAGKLSRTRRFAPTLAQESTKPVDLVSMNRVSDPPNAVDRVQSACKMQ